MLIFAVCFLGGFVLALVTGDWWWCAVGEFGGLVLAFTSIALENRRRYDRARVRTRLPVPRPAGSRPSATRLSATRRSISGHVAPRLRPRRGAEPAAAHPDDPAPAP